MAVIIVKTSRDKTRRVHVKDENLSKYGKVGTSQGTPVLARKHPVATPSGKTTTKAIPNYRLREEFGYQPTRQAWVSHAAVIVHRAGEKPARKGITLAEKMRQIKEETPEGRMIAKGRAEKFKPPPKERDIYSSAAIVAEHQRATELEREQEELDLARQQIQQKTDFIKQQVTAIKTGQPIPQTPPKPKYTAKIQYVPRKEKVVLDSRGRRITQQQAEKYKAQQLASKLAPELEKLKEAEEELETTKTTTRYIQTQKEIEAAIALEQRKLKDKRVAEIMAKAKREEELYRSAGSIFPQTVGTEKEAPETSKTAERAAKMLKKSAKGETDTTTTQIRQEGKTISGDIFDDTHLGSQTELPTTIKESETPMDIESKQITTLATDEHGNVLTDYSGTPIKKIKTVEGATEAEVDEKIGNLYEPWVNERGETVKDNYGETVYRRKVGMHSKPIPRKQAIHGPDKYSSKDRQIVIRATVTNSATGETFVEQGFSSSAGGPESEKFEQAIQSLRYRSKILHGVGTDNIVVNMEEAEASISYHHIQY